MKSASGRVMKTGATGPNSGRRVSRPKTGNTTAAPTPSLTGQIKKVNKSKIEIDGGAAAEAAATSDLILDNEISDLATRVKAYTVAEIMAQLNPSAPKIPAPLEVKESATVIPPKKIVKKKLIKKKKKVEKEDNGTNAPVEHVGTEQVPIVYTAEIDAMSLDEQIQSLIAMKYAMREEEKPNLITDYSSETEKLDDGRKGTADTGTSTTAQKKKKAKPKTSSNLNTYFKNFYQTQNEQVEELHRHVYDLQIKLEAEVKKLVSEIEDEHASKRTSSSRGDKKSQLSPCCCNTDIIGKFKNLLQKQKQIIGLQTDLHKRYGVGTGIVHAQTKTEPAPLMNEGNNNNNANFELFAPYACERDGKMVFYCSSCDVSSESEMLFRLHLESPMHVVKAYEEFQKGMPAVDSDIDFTQTSDYYKEVMTKIRTPCPRPLSPSGKDEANSLKNFV